MNDSEHVKATDNSNLVVAKLSEEAFLYIKKKGEDVLNIQIRSLDNKAITPTYSNYTISGFAKDILSHHRPIKDYFEEILNPVDMTLDRTTKRMLQDIARDVQEYFAPSMNISSEKDKEDEVLSVGKLDLEKKHDVQMLQFGYVEDEKYGYVCESFHAYLKDSDELEHLVLVSVANLDEIRGKSETSEGSETTSDTPRSYRLSDRHIKLMKFKDKSFKKNGVILSNPLSKWTLNKQVAYDASVKSAFYLGFYDQTWIPAQVMKECFIEIFDSISRYVGIENRYQKSYTALLPMATYFWQVFPKGGLTKVGGGHLAGKSNWSNFVNLTCYHAGSDLNINPSNSFMFRSIDSYKSTLIIDENNNYDAGITTEIINACHSRSGGSVSRMEKTQDDSYIPTTHNVYCPVILSGVKVELRPDTMSRTINVELFTDKDNDYVEPSIDFYAWEDVRNKLMMSYLLGWAEVIHLYNRLDSNELPLNPYDESFTLKARDKDIWLPIFTILNYIDGEEIHFSNLVKHVEMNKMSQEIDSLTDSLKIAMFKVMARLKSRITDEDDLWYSEKNDNVAILFKDIKMTAKIFGYEESNHTLDKDMKKLLNITEKGRHPDSSNRGSTRIFSWDMLDSLCLKSFDMTLEEIDKSFEHLEEEGNKIDSWMSKVIAQ